MIEACEVTAVAERAPSAPETQDGEPRRRSTSSLFTPDQQKAFDKAFAKREAKIRGEFEQMRTDLLETIALTGQLLDRCRDRISAEDQRAIRSGLQAIWTEYQREAKCRTH